MTKQDIHQRFIDQLAAELESMTLSAKRSFDTATDTEHHAKSKYETFSLETSYLARGQAKRVKELTTALELLRLLPLKTFDAATPVQLSALVRLEAADGERRCLFFGPAAGGEAITATGETITILTSSSPLGQAILGEKTGHTFGIKIGGTRQTFTIVSVE